MSFYDVTGLPLIMSTISNVAMASDHNSLHHTQYSAFFWPDEDAQFPAKALPGHSCLSQIWTAD
jgi:hypothetical protein